jgi:hypothetical protein
MLNNSEKDIISNIKGKLVKKKLLTIRTPGPERGGGIGFVVVETRKSAPNPYILKIILNEGKSKQGYIGSFPTKEAAEKAGYAAVAIYREKAA